MTAVVSYSRYEDIGVITLNNPPVNSLSLAVRQALGRCFRQAMSDENTSAVVIISARKLFSSGADITEFRDGSAFDHPTVPELLLEIESSSKLTVAALNGNALGGGFELALACDYRIALPQVQAAQPEVTLGLLPGAGATQRLPRIAGVETALRIITGGAMVAARDLYDAKIIDHLCQDQGSFTEAVIAYVKQLLQTKAPLRPCSGLPVDTSSLPDNFFQDFRTNNARLLRGNPAAEMAIQSVEYACHSTLAEGLAKEAALFRACLDTPEARALQHLFFAERAAKKVPGISQDGQAVPLESVAVIGAGRMGVGIVICFLNAGIKTAIIDVDCRRTDHARAHIQHHYETLAGKGRITPEQVQQAMSLLHSATDYHTIADADLVIEAVPEEMAIKKKVFETLDRICKPGAILASNTSTLDLNKIAQFTSRPTEVIGLHFFSPANVMPLLEIVEGERTASDVVAAALNIAKLIKKVPVVAKVCWGFIGNRMVEPYCREAARLVLEGASPAQIDRVLSDFGWAMGMPSMIDLAGIDVAYLARQGNYEALYGKDPSYAAICDELYRMGRYGQKTGRGFYLYEGRQKREDPEVNALAATLAKKYGVKRREVPDQEVFERTLYVLINEGAKILAEGVAGRSGDIDVVYCNGYGFPEYRGGPMQYADEVGLEVILKGLEKYRSELDGYGEIWFEPAPLLVKLVGDGGKFGEYKVGANLASI